VVITPTESVFFHLAYRCTAYRLESHRLMCCSWCPINLVDVLAVMAVICRVACVFG